MNKYWVWFSRIYKIGPVNQNKLLERYKLPEKIWNLSKKELEKNKFLKEEQINIILDKMYRINLEKYIEYMKKNKIYLISINDKYYPEKLKNIYDAPAVIYLKGNKKILNKKSIAIIGSRNCSNYGMTVTKRFTYELAKNNIIVISGLARGIDKYAHIGTLHVENSTIAVCGCGLDRVYPSENKNIFDKIIEKNGVVISEYVIGIKPEKDHFPARNRIISGLSDGVLVIEANSRSGTFITVDFALEQGKNIYAIPRKYF